MGGHIEARGEHLTNHVQNAAGDDSPLAADHVGDIAGDDGTEEGTGGEDGDDERQMRAGESSCVSTLDGLVEDGIGGDTVDVTRVIAEEDTAERGKGAQLAEVSWV